MKRLVLTAFAVLAMASVGSAADMAVKAPPPPPSSVMTWTGFYAGFNVGGLWNERANVDHVGTPGLCAVVFAGCVAVPSYAVTAATASTFNSGFGNNARFIGGVQAGANYQIANTRAVIGVEADIQGLDGRDAFSITRTVANPGFPGQDVTYTGTFGSRIDYFGTVRGRVGYAFAPAFLAYATGGFAYAGVRYSAIDTLSTAGQGQPVTGTTTTNISATLTGFAIGGGFEWKFKPNWSLKAEYLYYDLGRLSYGTSVAQVVPGIPNPFGGANIATTVAYRGDIVRVGLNYYFGGPVVAKY